VSGFDYLLQSDLRLRLHWPGPDVVSRGMQAHRQWQHQVMLRRLQLLLWKGHGHVM